MSQTHTCPTCGKELEGAAEATYIRIGKQTVYFWNETQDCNWSRCRVCKKIFCKDCFNGEEQTCSNECFFIGISKQLKTYIEKSSAESSQDEAAQNAEANSKGTTVHI